mmetsp:Transcript_3732/g.8520  ORF Transcript_3732/g.8520 Transcript_3732/m.8520 type:complete len:208 (-) Transcript_3732:71-694(-)
MNTTARLKYCWKGNFPGQASSRHPFSGIGSSCAHVGPPPIIGVVAPSHVRPSDSTSVPSMGSPSSSADNSSRAAASSSSIVSGEGEGEGGGAVAAAVGGGTAICVCVSLPNSRPPATSRARKERQSSVLLSSAALSSLLTAWRLSLCKSRESTRMTERWETDSSASCRLGIGANRLLSSSHEGLYDGTNAELHPSDDSMSRRDEMDR